MPATITTSADLFAPDLTQVFADGLPVGSCRPLGDLTEAHKLADGSRRRFTRPEAAYSWLGGQHPTPRADRPQSSNQISLW